MKKTNTENNKGFTLIELLVVVAIIGLLASIVLVSLEDARNRAKNSKKNQMVMQYINALELYRSDHQSEGYPDYGNISIGNFYCLGVDSGDSCQGTLDGNDDLIIDLEEYIPGVPADDVSVMISGRTGPVDHKGFAYTCADLNNIENDGDCKSYKLIWYLLGSNQNCISDAEEDNNVSGITYCEIIK